MFPMRKPPVANAKTRVPHGARVRFVRAAGDVRIPGLVSASVDDGEDDAKDEREDDTPDDGDVPAEEELHDGQHQHKDQ